MSALRATRYAAWGLVAIATLALAAFVVWQGRPADRGATVSIGGPFTLTDQRGATVTEAALKGRPSLVFFGFTFCPDVCPTTLFEASDWLQELGPDADRLTFYYVTVDPERDTREKMAEYLSAFDPRIVGLTGSRAAIDPMLKAYRVYSRKVETTDGGYTMDHTASIYMMDRDGRFTGVISYQEPKEQALAKIRRLLAGG